MAGRLSFKGGVHPLGSIHHGKRLTQDRPIQACSVPEEVVIPLSQHTGAPSRPVVSPGDRVDLGQLIAQAEGFVSVPCYSSVSGTVKEIAPRPHISGVMSQSIVITNDYEDRLSKDIAGKGSLESLSAKQITDIIKDAGIVGLGGAAFPTHVKLSPPPEKKIDTIIINGAECEPYLTADHRIMLEHPDKVVAGVKAVNKALGVTNAVIAIEENKKDAIAAIGKAASGVNVATLKVKYPQGAEKQLIYAVTKRRVPSGKLPMDVGVVVINAGTAYQIALSIETGMPLIERVVTVPGSVKQPSNFLVRIGTPLSYVIEQAGGFAGDIEKVIAGGPMMGIAQSNLNAPVMKGTSGILVLSSAEARMMEETACIYCGRCVDVCPMGLEPYLLNNYAAKGDFEAAEKAHVMDCMECGGCSYICPAGRYITQRIKLAKSEIVKRRKAAK